MKIVKNTLLLSKLYCLIPQIFDNFEKDWKVLRSIVKSPWKQKARTQCWRCIFILELLPLTFKFRHLTKNSFISEGYPGLWQLLPGSWSHQPARRPGHQWQGNRGDRRRPRRDRCGCWDRSICEDAVACSKPRRIFWITERSFRSATAVYVVWWCTNTLAAKKRDHPTQAWEV